MKKIRWGIISTAKIGRTAVIPGLKKSKESEVLAIASRNIKSAKKYANELGIPRAYGSYEELFQDPDIDAVYNPLPNHLHIPVSLQAAKHGKHILCEKPVAINAKEAEKLLKLPKGILFMEAFMVRFHLQWKEALKIIKEKKLGKVCAIQIFFSYFNADAKNIRNVEGFGGGGMYDIGCYPMTAGKYFFGSKPKRVIATTDIDPKFGVDRMCSAIYDFDKGQHLTFTVSTQLSLVQHLLIVGTKGSLQIPIPFNPKPSVPHKILLNDGSTLDGSNIKTVKIPACDQYQLECEALNRAIRGEEKLEYSVKDAIENMRIIDATFKSVKLGKWVDV